MTDTDLIEKMAEAMEKVSLEREELHKKLIQVCEGIPDIWEIKLERELKVQEERDKWKTAYETAYEDGESSGYADWIMQISEFTSLEKINSLSDVVKGINELEAEVARLRELLGGFVKNRAHITAGELDGVLDRLMDMSAAALNTGEKE